MSEHKKDDHSDEKSPLEYFLSIVNTVKILDILKKGIVIELDKRRTFKIGMAELMEIERVVGRPFTDIISQPLSAMELLEILRIGLSGENPELSTDDVSRIVEECPNIGERFSQIVLNVAKEYKNSSREKGKKIRGTLKSKVKLCKLKK